MSERAPKPGSPFRLLVLSAMYPRPDDAVLGIVVRREVDALRARECQVAVIGKAPGWGGYLVQVRHALGALERDFDVVHAHFGTSAFVAAGVRLLRGGGPPLVVTLHGSDVATGARPQWTKYWLQFWLSCLGCLAARHVIVQDESMLRVLPGRIRRRAEVLGQGIDPARFGEACPRDPHHVLFLSDRARTVKRFGLAQAAVAAAATPGLRLDSLDRHDVEAIPSAMARAGIGLITSEREGMPVAVKEALAAGLPVLAVDLPPLRRLAASFPQLVTLVPAEPLALGRALDRLVAAPAPTAQERARALASLGELHWIEPERTDRLVEIYRAASGRGGPADAARAVGAATAGVEPQHTSGSGTGTMKRPPRAS